MKIDGSVALVIGAAQGVGLEYVKVLLQYGAKVHQHIIITVSIYPSGNVLWGTCISVYTVQVTGVLTTCCIHSVLGRPCKENCGTGRR